MSKKLSAVLIILLTLTYILQLHTNVRNNLQKSVAESIIRFHVIANSDSKEDQELKYQVKNALVNALYPYFKDINNISDARSFIKNNLPMIEEEAKKVINDFGYAYPVSATFTTSYFPMKVYGEYAFPPGQYEALQVRIGNAKGKNWWCVMFPPLCFVDETYSIVSEDSEKKLKYLLTDDELDLLRSQKAPVKIKFKLFDSIKNLLNNL